MRRKETEKVDRTDIEERLKSGAENMKVFLADEMLEKLVDYIYLLHKWNATYNLTALKNPGDMLTHHVLDSLSVVSFLVKSRNILDVGSGGGLPGLVLAIVYPEKHVSMVDIVQKKTAFLNQARIELGLDNVTIHTGRVEKLQVEKKFDAIISRAFSSLPDFVGLSGHLLDRNGRFYAMKGLIPSDEISNLPSGWKVERIDVLNVPSLDAQRHLIVIGPESVIIDNCG